MTRSLDTSSCVLYPVTMPSVTSSKKGKIASFYPSVATDQGGNASDQSLSFSSSRTLSHNTAPTSTTKFSILEGLPHNKVHNFVGGVGPLSPGPFGNMANNLSPIDPIFFLHHSNMDRLWDLWTRKQQMLGLPYLPEGEDYNVYASEPFLFFVNGEGQYLGPAKAGDFISTHPFDYDYQPGSGEAILQNISLQPRGDKPMSARTAVVQENIAALSVSSSDIKRHLSATTVPVILLEITLPHDVVMSSVRVDRLAGQAGGNSFRQSLLRGDRFCSGPFRPLRLRRCWGFFYLAIAKDA